jgi:hypothetical protein
MSERRHTPTLAAIVSASVALWTPVALAAPEPEAAGSEAEAEPEPTAEPAPEPEPKPAVEPEPEPPLVTEVEKADALEGGGVAGSVVAADDPSATQAQADLEGEALDRQASGVPDRMPRLKIAAWWTMFGAVALATGGGIFSGLAERQEDEAERLALGFDLETGKRFEYEEHADEYAEILDKGNTYQWVSRGFLIGAGVALVTSVTLFAVQAKRTKKERQRVSLRRLGPGAVEVAF